MEEKKNVEQELISPVSFKSEELRQQARLDAVGGNPNKVPHGYIILFTYHNDHYGTEWMRVDSREELRQTIIDILESSEDHEMSIDVDNSYVLPEGWTLSFDEDWRTVYEIMKHIEPFFDSPEYEPFDIEDYV